MRDSCSEVTTSVNNLEITDGEATRLMLEGPVVIGCGLTRRQFVHLVCSFYFFDTVLYETLFSSDLGFVLLCWGPSPPIALTSL